MAGESRHLYSDGGKALMSNRAYIRGHPFWTPAALGLAKETGVQVFGESMIWRAS